MMRWGRRALAALCAAGLALGGAGCARIPDSGPIGTTQVSGDSQNVQSRIDPDGPAPGASPAAIVRGFLSAGAGSANNFAVARSYLTDDFSATWNPLKSVSIVAPSSTLENLTAEVTTNSRNVSFAVPIQAVLDANRVYRESSAGTVPSLKFSLRQVNGEWRIAQAPDGIVVSEDSFKGLFQAYPLYFYTLDYRHLVPDVRWFLRSSNTLTEVVSHLLKGPADYLSGAVTSALPEGTALEPKVVTAEGGAADIGLSQAASGLDAKTNARIFTQISQTVRANTSISVVRVLTARGELTKGSEVSAEFTVEAAPVAVSGGRLATLNGNTFDPVPGSPNVPAGTVPAQSYSAKRFYLLSRDRKRIDTFEIGGRTSTLFTGGRLAGLSVDRFGWVYTAEDAGAKLRAISPTGNAVTLDMPFAKKRRISRLAVSRDGTRLAVLSHGADGTARADVIGIIRGRDGSPDQLASSAPLAVGQKFAIVRDIAWAGSSMVVVLAGDAGDGYSQPQSLWVGGPSAKLGSITDAANLTAGSDIHSVRVGTDNGDIYTFTSGAWQRIVGAQAWNPAYPG